MKTCGFENCSNKRDSHGFCANHARQFRKHGHPLSKEEVSAIRSELRKRSSGNLGTRWTGEMKVVQSKKLKGRTLNSGRTHFPEGGTAWNKGKAMSEEVRFKLGVALKGRVVWNKGVYGLRCGPDNPNWKGGAHTANNAIRRTKRYANWRKQVFERDNYTCQFCWVRGGLLEADHIKPFAFFPDLRFELGNGRTLCHDCHSKTPTYKKHSYQEFAS